MPSAGQTLSHALGHPAIVSEQKFGESSRVRMARAGGTISGRITNEANGKPIGGVLVQLIDASGDVVKTTRTNARGRYSFKVKENGPYVIHDVAPRHFVQAPNFSTTAPTDAMATNPATGQLYGSSSWNYRTGNNDPADGPVGPAAWSTVAPAGEEPFESPIDIQGAPIDLGRYLTINYNPAVPKQVIDNGAQIQTQINSSANDTITLAGQAYNLSQFHYHDPAENHVNGFTYPMEEHFVNVSASGAETVVAVFLQLGTHNAALQPVLDAATAHLTATGSSTTTSTPINFSGLLPSSLEGWFYEGSLTTPPLSQTVNWLVLATPITLDFAQLKQYEAVANGVGFLPGARPLQPLDGRQVNQFDIDVNFQGQSLTGENFTLTKVGVGASSVKAASAHAKAQVQAHSLAVLGGSAMTGNKARLRIGSGTQS